MPYIASISGFILFENVQHSIRLSRKLATPTKKKIEQFSTAKSLNDLQTTNSLVRTTLTLLRPFAHHLVAHSIHVWHIYLHLP